MENEMIIEKASGSVLASICIFVVIFIGLYIAYMLVQSIVQIIVCLFMRYTITSFSFAGLMVKYDGKRISFCLTPLRLIAVTTFFKENINGKIRITFESIVNLCTMVLAVISGFILVQRFGYNMFVKMALTGLAILIIFNIVIYVDFIKMAFANGESHKLWEYEMITKNKYISGANPKDIEPIEIDMNNTGILANRCRLYNYYHYLDAGQYDMLGGYIALFKSIIGDVDNVLSSNIPYAYEIIYYYSVINPNLNEAEHYYYLVHTVLEKDMDMNGRRVYAGYLFGTSKPVNQALETINQALTEENRMSGMTMRGLEMDLLSDLRERIARGGQKKWI